MKKLIASVVALIMVLSMIPVMTLSTSAAVEGDWTTCRFAGEYPQEGDDPDEEKVYKPEAGYTYTNEGFTVVPADYSDTTPSLTVITKEKKSIKDGVYLQFRIDDFSYDGGTGADHWICLSLTTEGKVEPGNTKFGGGWLTLLRGVGDGSCNTQPHLTDPATEDFGGTFNIVGQAPAEVPLDDQEREIYTLEIQHDGSGYHIFVNDVEQPGNDRTTALLDKLDANGEFYIGINMQAGVKNGTAAISILKFGTSEADATTPVGDDSKEPEENVMTIPEPFDPSTVETNMPAYLWTPETVNLKAGNNITFTVLGDNTWRAQASDAGVFFVLSAKRTWSYKAEDFPVFGILVRNLLVDGGSMFYAAGEVMGPTNGYSCGFSVYDGEFYGEEEEYAFIPVDLTDLWEGRINSIRLDIPMADESVREFDICFAGMFRSEEEGYAYAESYLEGIGVITAGTTEEETTEAPTEEPTAAPDEETTATPDGETTATPDGETTAAPADETEAPAKKGCKSVISFGAVAILTAAAAAVALKKKD